MLGLLDSKGLLGIYVEASTVKLQFVTCFVLLIRNSHADDDALNVSNFTVYQIIIATKERK